MNKNELVSAVAEQANISRKDADAAISASRKTPIAPRFFRSCATSRHARKTESGDAALLAWRLVPVPTR